MAEMEREPRRGSVDIARSDLISWSSIVAGVLSSFGLFVLLSVLGVAAGLEAGPGDTAPTFGPQIASIITGLFVVLAFLSGGFIAAWTADVDETESAVLHGFLVWALFVVLLLTMVAAGLGAGIGASSQIFSGTFDAADADAISDAGWAAVFGLVLAVGSSILGAVLAARPEVRSRYPFARR
jgi:Na+/citrate or Na+/malate symporter